jgi:hypothetical protein
MQWVSALEERIAQETWRSAATAEVLMRIKRRIAAELSTSNILKLEGWV